jgi:hypothetical protein
MEWETGEFMPSAILQRGGGVLGLSPYFFSVFRSRTPQDRKTGSGGDEPTSVPLTSTKQEDLGPIFQVIK